MFIYSSTSLTNIQMSKSNSSRVCSSDFCSLNEMYTNTLIHRLGAPLSAGWPALTPPSLLRNLTAQFSSLGPWAGSRISLMVQQPILSLEHQSFRKDTTLEENQRRKGYITVYLFCDSFQFFIPTLRSDLPLL